MVEKEMNVVEGTGVGEAYIPTRINCYKLFKKYLSQSPISYQP